MDANNLVGLDAEWGHGYKLRMACLHGRIDGKHVRKTLYPGDEPIHVPNVCYYVTPMDLEVSKSVLTYDTAIDTALLCNLQDNVSVMRASKNTFKYGRSLGARAARYLGVNLHHAVSSKTHNANAFKDWSDFTTAEKDELREHCREDAKLCYLLATSENVLRGLDIGEQFYKWCDLSKYWVHVMKNGIHINPDVVEYFKNPKDISCKVVSALEKIGCLAFYEKEGKIHISEKAFQAWFEATKEEYGWQVTYTPRAWENYKHYQRMKDDFHDLSNRGDKTATLIYLALELRQAQSRGQMLTETVYPLELPFDQQSGRASPKNHPIQAGTLLRSAVKPPEGYAYVSLDIKSQEVMLAAYLSQDPNLMEGTKVDVYSALWCATEGIPYQKLDKQDSRRAVAKVELLAYLYGGGRKTFKAKLAALDRTTTDRYSTNVERRLRAAYSQFERWRAHVYNDALYHGVVYTEIDMVPLYIAPMVSNPRQVVNHKIQGTAADQLRHLTAHMIDKGYTVVSTLFDGLYLQMPIEGIEEAVTASIAEAEAFLQELYPVHTPWGVEAVECQYERAKGVRQPYFTKGVIEKPGYLDLIKELGLWQVYFNE